MDASKENLFVDVETYILTFTFIHVLIIDDEKM